MHHLGYGVEVRSKNNGILNLSDSLVATNEQRDHYLDELVPIAVQQVDPNQD